MRAETLVQGRQRHALSLRDFGKPWDDSAVALIRLNAPGEAPLPGHYPSGRAGKRILTNARLLPDPGF